MIRIQPHQFVKPLVALIGLVLGTSANADLALHQTPLALGSAGEPNVLFILDNSASMENVPEETNYEFPKVVGHNIIGHQFACDASTDNPLPSGSDIAYEYWVDPSHGVSAAWGMAIIVKKEIGKADVKFELGNGTGTGVAYSKACFVNDREYRAFLRSMGGTPTSPDLSEYGYGVLAGFPNHAKYQGHYLNWYYGNSTVTGPDQTVGNYTAPYSSLAVDGFRKQAILSRYQYMVERMTDLTEDYFIDSAEMAVATFVSEDPIATQNQNSKSKLEIVHGFAPRASDDPDVATYDPAKVMDELQNILPRANTSLARGLGQAARYFLEGSPNKDIDLEVAHEGVGLDSIKTFELFVDEPVYSTRFNDRAGVSEVVRPGSGNSHVGSCQRNHMFIVTDGLSRKSSTYGASEGDASVTLNCKNGDSSCAGITPSGLNLADFPLDKAHEVLGRFDDGKWDYDDSLSASSSFSSSGAELPVNDLIGVTSALYNLDLRPDLSGHNNISTHIVGFDVDEPLDDDYLSKAAAMGGGLYVEESLAFDTERRFSMQRKLESIVNKIKGAGMSQKGTLSKVAFTTDSLEDDTLMLVPMFSSDRWDGDLRAWHLDADGAVDTAAGIQWRAAAQLDAKDTDRRNIFTMGVTGASIPTGVDFNWNDLTATQKEDLQTLAPAGLTESDLAIYGQTVLEYLRGNRTNEGFRADEFRIRDSVLGDIVHSVPVTVTNRSLGWPEYHPDSASQFGTSDRPYSAFVAANENREVMTYVGANDGMLHAFSVETGDERFAYIPGAMYSTAATEGLHYLTDKNYEHRYYVDAAPAVSDVFINSNWHTILVGGYGAGAKGLYALDVTDPANTTASQKVLWEFQHEDLGHVFGKPTIAMMANDRWGIVVGNGYNSASNDAFVFVIDSEGPSAAGSWEEGTNFWRIPVPINEGIGADNGLAEPAVVDIDGDSVADRIYAGDLKGNLWAFDVGHSNTGNWQSRFGDSPLFADQWESPITVKPLVRWLPSDITNSAVSDEPQVLVLFGTGQLMVESDVKHIAVNGIYAVSDKAQYTGSLTNSTLGNVTQDSEFLLQRTVLTNKDADDNPESRTILGEDDDGTFIPVNWQTHRGWWIRLAVEWDGGYGSERVIADFQVYSQGHSTRYDDDILLASTAIPTDLPCEQGGDAWEMYLNIYEGVQLSEARVDFDMDNVVNTGDEILAGRLYSEGIATSSSVLDGAKYEYKAGSGSNGQGQSTLIGDPSSGPVMGQPLSWQEVIRR